MAVVRDQEASSSAPRCAYDVFLSFRGEDTRKTFTDHLYTALDGAGIHTFRDDDQIERGENINIELQRAIQESRISIIVFSKDYASSRWCLNELVRILERKRATGHQILPVFYDVDPVDVRKQTGSFEKSFLRHEERFKAWENEEKSYWMDKLEEWKTALREVANLAGMVLRNEDDRYESKFIQKILKVIEDKLKHTFSSNAPFLIGLEARAKDINLWLEDTLSDVSILAICGMGGIGKSTVARHVYSCNFQKFASSSFLANVRETCEQLNGLVNLQKQLLSDILNRKQKIRNVYEGINRIKHEVCRKKVFVVLDDVDQTNQINLVLEFRDWLYPGSKILLTTRNKGLLKGIHNLIVHEITYLDECESFKLFNHHAFYPNHPFEAYVEHAKRAVLQCGGLPLALEVLGSTFRGQRRVEVWINTLEKLEAIPDNQILKKMRISYDSLSDDHDKNLFLDIACFFVGEHIDNVGRILDGCGYFTLIGIQNLIDRCMLKIENKKLMMHQWLRDMGREVVLQESPKEPGRRSRLWQHNDSLKILRHKTGTDAIEGLTLRMHLSQIEKPSKEEKSTRETICANKKRRILNILDTYFRDSNEVSLETSSFGRMHKLRLLQLNYVELKGDYKNFPKELKWLCWHGFTLKCIPRDLCLESLVVLDMSYSKLVEVWKGTKVLGSLKTLILSHSHSLVRISNFAAILNLESLILKDCASLVEVHESIEKLESLVLLNLEDCINLRKLPKSIGMLKSLETLTLSGCSNLVQEMNMTESSEVFCADRTVVNQSVSISWKLKPWHAFVMVWEPLRRNIPETSWLFLPPSLVSLSLANCNLSDDNIPMDFSCQPLLRDLDLSGNPICKLPDFIRSFTRLRSLWFTSCKRLQSLIGLPSMKFLNISHCTSLKGVAVMPSSTIEIIEISLDVPIASFFEFKPIEEADADIIHFLGLLNLETVANTEMNFYMHLSKRRERLPIQVLYDYHFISSIFIPGREVPAGWLFTNKSSHRGCAASLSFTVPSCSRNIRCLNVCCVYTLSSEKETWEPPPLFTKINNKSKDCKWIHGPRCFVVPEVGDEHVIWFSRWNVGHWFELDGGDEVNLTVVAGVGFQVKECGIDIVYYNDEKEKLASRLNCPYSNCDATCIGCYLGPQIGKTYFLFRRVEYYSHDESSRHDHWSSSDWGKKLFEDSMLTTEEVREELKKGSDNRVNFLEYLTMMDAETEVFE